MKLNGSIVRKYTTDDGEYEIVIRLSKVYSQYVKELEKDSYVIDMTRRKPKRSNDQNAMMWAIIHDIAEKRNGRANTENEWDVYIEALENAGAKYELFTCLPQAEDMLRAHSRAIKYVSSYYNKGKKFNAYKVFYGSSTMTTEEMSKLLDEVLDMAAKEGIYY